MTHPVPLRPVAADYPAGCSWVTLHDGYRLGHLTRSCSTARRGRWIALTGPAPPLPCPDCYPVTRPQAVAL
jgi:hypothetical protein